MAIGTAQYTSGYHSATQCPNTLTEVSSQVLDTHGNMLVQQRSAEKDTHPSEWDVSVAGHIGAGDESRATAARECGEEIGLEETAQLLCTLYYAGTS